jgi:hypothetical protein
MIFVRCLLVLFALLPGLALDANAMTATKWRDMSEDSKRSYVAGVIDTWINLDSVVSQVGAKERTPAERIFTDVARCVTGRKLTSDDLYTVMNNYVEKRPDRRDYIAASIVWNAVAEACGIK